MGARDRIRAYFEEHVGQVVSTHEIARVAAISEYARRIRELRNEEGMQILSHRDRHDLQPGEYMLETLERKPALARAISPQMRNQILERNGYTCQHCGCGPADPDPFNARRRVILHIDHDKPLSQGGTNDPDNLRVLCSACNQARGNVQTPSETALNLIARIRHQSRSVGREVYEALKRTFGE